MLTWQHDAGTVSIWTVTGRMKNVAYTGSPDQLKAVAGLPVGECDLVHRDGMWFLYATVEVAEARLVEPQGFLGVDKARRAGVALVQVDPRYTSQTCSKCGYRDSRNRPDQATFICRSCGVVAHADVNAAVNIAVRGAAGWGAVNRPYVA